MAHNEHVDLFVQAGRQADRPIAGGQKVAKLLRAFFPGRSAGKHIVCLRHRRAEVAPTKACFDMLQMLHDSIIHLHVCLANYCSFTHLNTAHV